MTQTTETTAWYALRRTLPNWSFAENLRELQTCLPRYGVDEVIVKVDTEEFSHGQPPYEWVKAYQANLFRVRDAMRALGIRYSLNPWITLGHCDRGRDGRANVPGLRTMVGHDGAECACCACPLDPAWRGHLERVWTLYAETEPHVVWVEDDIRTFNHSPVEFGCFCPEHLREFSRRIGRAVGREELVAALLQPGAPHPWRAGWLNLQAEVMIETAAFLRRTIHRVSPRTSLGLMSSGPRMHCLEGRRWREFAVALAGDRPLYSRPPMGNYSEDSLRGFYWSHDSIKLTRHCLPAGTIEQTEVESVPFTRYSKSVVYTGLEIAIAFAYGAHGVTMNLFDHTGTPMESEPWYGAMLGARKPFLNALAGPAQKPGRFLGIRLLHHDRSSCTRRLPPGAGYAALAEDGYDMMQAFEAHGLPTTYEAAPVAAACGQTVRALTDDELRDLLRGGLFLDVEAARVFIERGFGPEVGLASITEPVCADRLGALSCEEFVHPGFGGADRKYLTLTVPTLGGRPGVGLMQPLPGAETVSMLVDPDARRMHPAMTAFRNRLGGRVVVHALAWERCAAGVAFCHPFRGEQLRGVVRWLGGDEAPPMVRGGVWPLALCRVCDDGTVLLGLFNLSLDPWPYAEFDLSASLALEGLERLRADGRWAADGALAAERRDGRAVVRYNGAVPFDEPLFVRAGKDPGKGR